MKRVKHSLEIVSFIKEKYKEIIDFTCALDLDEIDFVGGSSSYVIEKIDMIINHLQAVKKDIKNK